LALKKYGAIPAQIVSFKTVKNDGRYTDTYLDYAQSFVDYVLERGSVGKLPASEYSTQSMVK